MPFLEGLHCYPGTATPQQHQISRVLALGDALHVDRVPLESLPDDGGHLRHHCRCVGSLWAAIQGPHFLQWQIVFQWVCAGDGIGKSRTPHHNAASVFRGVSHADAVLRKAWQRQSIKIRTQDWAQVLEATIRPPRGHNATSLIQCGKIRFEGNVSRVHVQPRPHRLESSSASIIPARVIAQDGEVCGVGAACQPRLHRIQQPVPPSTCDTVQMRSVSSLERRAIAKLWDANVTDTVYQHERQASGLRGRGKRLGRHGLLQLASFKKQPAQI
mmetsp:Transcript_16234/g.48635  ORF Transcript_16234/g.48635 Transcript_16234/m.48635 type:complete len:272 (-) Transcript_16234:259-1074(-)